MIGTGREVYVDLRFPGDGLLGILGVLGHGMGYHYGTGAHLYGYDQIAWNGSFANISGREVAI